MTSRRNSDCSKGRFVATETCTLATCRPMEIMLWDCGDDRRAELLGVCGGRHRHVRQGCVITRLLGMASKATTAQCRVLWMCCLERSEPVKLGCMLERSEAGWAIAHFSSRAL